MYVLYNIIKQITSAGHFRNTNHAIRYNFMLFFYADDQIKRLHIHLFESSTIHQLESAFFFFYICNDIFSGKK